MSAQIIRIPRPTRIELLRLRRRLALARRFYNLLRDRETYLLETFRETLKLAVEARSRLNELLARAYASYYASLYLHGLEAVEEFSATIPQTLKLQVGYKNVMGIWCYTYRFADIPAPQPHIPVEFSDIQVSRREILELIAKIAEYEKILVNIGAEIRRLRRIVSMLEKIYIPRLEKTIKYLTMKFDEMGREEVIRIIKIKKKLEARTS
jgi:V/A-type H+-transporting ATPase subunit D